MVKQNQFDYAVAMESQEDVDLDAVRENIEDAYSMIDDEYHSLTPDEVAAAQISVLENEYEADSLMRDAERAMVIADVLRQVADTADRISEPNMQDRQMIMGVLNVATAGADISAGSLAPGLEQYGSGNRLAMESLRESASKIWEQIKKAIAEITRLINEQIQALSLGHSLVRKKLDALIIALKNLQTNASKDMPPEVKVHRPGLVPADIRVTSVSGIQQCLMRNDELLAAVYRYGLGFQYAVESLPRVINDDSSPDVVMGHVKDTMARITAAPLAQLEKGRKVFPGAVVVKEDQLRLGHGSTGNMIIQTYHLERGGETTPEFTIVNPNVKDISRVLSHLTDAYNGAVKFSKVIQNISKANEQLLEKTDRYAKSISDNGQNGINDVFRFNLALNRWQYDLFVATTRNTMAVVSRCCDVLNTCISSAR